MKRMSYLYRRKRRKGAFAAAVLTLILVMNGVLPVQASQSDGEKIAAETIVVSSADGEEITVGEMAEAELEEALTSAATPMDGTEILGRRAKLSASGVTLYLARKNRTAETFCYFNAKGDYTILPESLIPTQTAKIPYAPELSLENTTYNGLPAIRIMISGDQNLQKGNYTYRLIPYDRENNVQLKAVTLKISVKADTVYPGMKINMPTVTLNKQIPGDYAYVYPLLEGARILPLDSALKTASIGSGLNVELVNESTARISIKNQSAVGSALKATLWFYYGPEWNYKVVKKTITVKRTASLPKLSLKAEEGGRLDLLQRDAFCMEYSPAVSRTGFVVKSIDVSDADRLEFDRQFVLETEEDTNGDVRLVRIRLKPESNIYPGARKYAFRYLLHGSGSDAKEIAGELALNLKTVQGNAVMQKQSPVNLKLSQSAPGGMKGYVHYLVNTPVFASISEDSVKENFNELKIPQGAFSTKVRVDEYGHLATIEVKADPEKVEAGKKYTLNYNVFPEGGAGHKYTKLKITVTITE